MEENIREAMTAAHDNMQEKMQEKVAEVKNTLDSLEGTSRANRFMVTGYTIYNAVLLACYLVEVIKGSRSMVDEAPTMAAMLGLTMPDVDGAPIFEILR